MKLTTVILFAIIMQASATTFAQKVTLNQRSVTLKQLFKTIRQQTGYDVLYQPDKVDESQVINANFNQTPLKDVLEKALSGQSLEFTITEKTVVIKLKEPSLIDKAKAFFAQVTVFGKVTDESGQPLAGVTVKIKNTNQATATDNKGFYTLTVPDDKTVITFSYVGFETQELMARDIPNGSVITIKAILTNLHEVIVNKGYYTERQELSTGNVSKVSAEVIGAQPVSDPLATLEGRVPGLQISQSSGIPGRGFNVQIRGLTSIGQGTNPLYIVDGVPFYVFANPQSSFDNSSLSTSAYIPSSPFNSINPADIESIEVLKDADATSIYGTRGANGVILITTKKGKIGKNKADFNVYQGIGKATNIIQMLNTQQYLQLRHQAFRNDGVVALPANAYDINGTWDTTRYTNWPKVALGGTAHYTDAQGTYSGGTVNTQFLLSGGYHNETTILPGDSYSQKGSLHASINHRSIDNKFKLNFNSFSSVLTTVTPMLNPALMITLAPDAPSV